MMKPLHIIRKWVGARCTQPGSVSRALGGPRGGCRATSQDTAPSKVLTHCVRAVFPLGKDQTLALYKNLQDESQGKMSWHSGVVCGNQGLKRGCAWVEGCCGRIPRSGGGFAAAPHGESLAPGFLAGISSCL